MNSDATDTTIRYISIDCATKSLAISVVDYNNIPLNLRDKETFRSLDIVKTFTKNLLPGRDNSNIKDIERVSLVCNFIKNEVMQYIESSPNPVTILLERQIATTPTYIVYITLMTLFIQKEVNVDTIAAARKNQLSIDDEKIGKYLRTCTDSYKANKLHSKGLVNCIRSYLSNNDKIEINQKMITDWSDTISQLIAYIIYHQKTYAP